MKSLSTAAMAMLLAASPFAFAQEESPSPAPKLDLRATDPTSRTEPTVSVPSERSAEDYPKPGTPLTTPTPAVTSASPSPSPKATKNSSRSKPAATPKPTGPSPSPAAVSAKAPEAAVRELENKWLNALQTHDTAAVQPLVADSYIGVTSGGRFVNKAGLLAEIKKDTNNYQSATNARMDVRVHGDTVVVVGTTRQSGKDSSGKAFTYTARWTDTWAFREGQWLCIGSQSMQVPK
jgi:ketosteroid isomerase-like protein